MTDTVRLNTLKPGDKCLIIEIKATGITGQRLMDLGIIPGVVIEVVRNAPLVDPVQLLVRDNHISIRHSEAREIGVILL